jgi:hypothetical protein
MVSTAFASMPAAARLATSDPAVGAIWPPEPVSMRTSLLPLLMTSGVKGVGSHGSAGRLPPSPLHVGKIGVARQLVIFGRFQIRRR